MALRLDGRHFGELYDYWNGLIDLQKKEVKVLHSLSFVDDPTRLIRAARFEQRFQFKIETRTLQLMAEARPLIKQVSGDRLRHEFDLIFKEASPLPILARMEELSLLTAIHPALHWQEDANKSMKSALLSPIPENWQLPLSIDHMPLRQTLAYLTWLTPLGETTALEIANRFHLNNTLIKALHQSCRVWIEKEKLSELTNSDFFDQVSSCPPVAGYAVFLLAKNSPFKEKIERTFTHWINLIPGVDGNTLKEMGLVPGPRYSEIIHRVRSAWINGEIITPQQETDLVKELIHS
jgi:tRNA nucleotidyltransferase (CCA-adding enzyme)